MAECPACGSDLGIYKYRCPTCKELLLDRPAEPLSESLRNPQAQPWPRRIALVVIGCCFCALAIPFSQGFSHRWKLNRENARLREGYLEYLGHVHDSLAPSVVKEFLAERIFIESRRLPGAEKYPVTQLIDTIYIDPDLAPNGDLDPKTIERTAGIFVHEVRHFKDQRGGLPIICLEEELLAYADEALFVKHAIEQGLMRNVSLVDHVVMGAKSCEPFWNCPLSDFAVVAPVASQAITSGRIDDVAETEWANLKILAAGWGAFARYHLRNTGSTSVFDNAADTIPKLAYAIEITKGVLAHMDDPDEVLVKRLADLERQFRIWSDPSALAEVRNHYQKALEDEQRLVNADFPH